MSCTVVDTCDVGIYDVGFDDIPDGAACTSYNQEYLQPDKLPWMVFFAGFVMCVMAFGIGANDLANAWGTSVGSGAIGLRAATIVAGLSEWLGAVTLGYGVSSTIQKGVSETTSEHCWGCGYCDSKMSIYEAAMLGALIGAALFLGLATFTAMPVSTTHAIIGGVVGGTWGAVGWDCLNWSFAFDDLSSSLSGIVLSWVISPIFAGCVGAATYLITKKFIFDNDKPLERALFLLPLLYAMVSFVMTYLILSKSKPTKYLDDDTFTGATFLISGCAFAFALVVTACFLNPFIEARLPSKAFSGGGNGLQGRKSERKSPEETITLEKTGIEMEWVYKLHNTTLDVPGRSSVLLNSKLSLVSNPMAISGLTEEDLLSENGSEAGDDLKVGGAPVRASRNTLIMQRPLDEANATSQTPSYRDAMFCFKYLLVFNAALESFAHGANDTANATAAFSAVYISHREGIYACEPEETGVWIMAVAGFFVLLGCTTVGYRVIKTVGENVVAIDFHKGFCIEFASTVAVVVASYYGLPVSSTHCQIGAVTFVGLAAFGPSQVSWGLLSQIGISWILTLPLAGGVSALVMSIIRSAIKQ